MADPQGWSSATAETILAALMAARIVPVVRTSTPALAETAVAWLAEAGFRIFEITLTIPDATGVMKRLSASDDLLVGAGTVLSPDAALACVDSGARFIVSPAIVEGLPAACHGGGAACLLGALTPSEVLRAAAAGAHAVKVFPASSAGGPAHIRALKAVFPDVPLVPTGGVGPEEVSAYLDAGAAFVGLGGRLVDETRIKAGRRDEIIAAARALQARLRPG